MSQSPTSTPPRPAGLTTSKDAFARAVPRFDVVGLEDQIRERAHQLYEERDREPGKHDQDWLQAEREILEKRPPLAV
jgi:hypothetical protein